MNRRSFITKALAGLAVVPLLGKLAEAQTVRPYAVGENGPEFFKPAALGDVVVSWSERNRRMEAFQSDLFVEAAKVYPRALTDVEVVKVFVSSTAS